MKQGKGQRGQNRDNQKKGRQGGDAAPPWYAPPETAKQAHHIAATEARTETRPLERTIQAEKRASQKRTGEVGSWWNDYLAKVSGSQAEAQAAYNNAATQTQGFIDQTSAIDSANTSRLNTEAADSAALRGTTAPTAPAATEAAGQAQRNYLSAAYGAANAQRGANQYAYLSDQKRIGAGQSVKSRMDEQKRGISIGQDLREVRAQRGAKTVEKMNEQRKIAAASALEKWKVNKAFPLEKQAAAADAADTAHDNALGDRNAGIAQQNANTSKYNAHHESGEGGGRTPGERRDAKEGRQNAYRRTLEFIKSHGFPKGPEAHAELVEKIEEGEGIGPKEARWAVAQFEKKNKGGNRGIPGTTKTPYAP